MAWRLGGSRWRYAVARPSDCKNTSPAHWLVARRSGTFLRITQFYGSPLLHVDRFAIRVQGALNADLLTLVLLGEFLLVDVVRRPVR